MRCLALAVIFLAATPAAHARLYERTPPRIELGLEVAFPIYDADTAFADLRPAVLFGLVGGLYVAPDLRLGFVARAAISDPDSEHYEVLADLTYAWVDEPRLPEPPALRLAASLELGWRHDDLTGSDFVVIDQGFMVSLAGELGIVVFEDVALSLQLALISGTTTNDAIAAWSPKLRTGLTLATVF